ncbi:type I-F CRISPR-associated protein Csy1 [Acinetobacter towneri]|uniref:type I-F CRISPR-associated protein Csy1 n=1 Tax=Acinetobacter TaxID=469 RepID=UPI0015D329D9|nr:type I-F CRISPR-associated protein Csy1 [Acinetobacter sp. YH01004]
MTKDTEENPYQQALAESVHYSLKTVNSNIEKGGIRLAQSHALNLPYISARTLLADDFLVPTDYQANAGKTATLFKVVKAAQLDEELSEADEEFKQNVALLKPHLNKIFEQPFTAGLDIIDIRMRQLLIPKNNEYLSISPLSAAGLNLLINTEVDALKEQRKAEGKNTKLKNIKTVVFGIGGSNPQNVGSLVRSMQRPLVLDSPTQDPETRLAFQYFYKGFDYQISNAYINRAMYQELTEYAKSLIEQQKLSLKVGFHEHGIHAPFSNMQTRAAELTTIQKVVDDVLQQGQDILQILKSVANDLPSLKVLERKSRWSHPRVSLIAQGLINPELQQFEDWQQFFADDLARRITKHSYWKKEIKNTVDISLSEADAKSFLSRRIQELLK